MKEVIYKKGHAKIDKRRVPLTDNNIIEQVSVIYFYTQKHSPVQMSGREFHPDRYKKIVFCDESNKISQKVRFFCDKCEKSQKTSFL